MPCLQPFRGDSAQLLLYKIASCLNEGGFVAGVSSFNGQTGVVTLTGADVIALLGCTPACEGDVVNSFNGQTGDVTLTVGDVASVADARYVLKTGDSMSGALFIDNGSIAGASAPVLTLSQTWNDAAVSFVGVLTNITSTAADSGSNLFDVQKNAASVFNLRTDGRLTLLGRASFTSTSVGHGLFQSDASTTATPTILTLGHLLSSGVAGVGMGVSLNLNADSTTTGNTQMAKWIISWTDPTHATRSAQALFTSFVGGVDTQHLILGAGVIQSGTLGTAALPVYTHRNDLDTGLFFNGTNDLFISAGGTQVAAFTDTTGVILSTSFTLPYVAKVANYTITALDHTIDCTSGTFTVTLPTAVAIAGRVYVIKNSGVGSITLDGNGAQTIDTLATQSIVSGGAMKVQSDGANWIII